MVLSTGQTLWLLGGTVVGYLTVMFTVPVRGDLGSGWLCLLRYQRIWLLPAAFEAAHGSFGWWLRLRGSVSTDGTAALAWWDHWNPPGWSHVLAESALPATESTAGIFNSTINSFPLSALGAALFLGNWRRCQAVIWRSLRQRHGWMVCLTIYVPLLVCAVAAVCKPIVFCLLPRATVVLSETTWLRGGEAINTASFFFEYLLGVGVQTYLVLLVFAWLRGLTFDFAGLRRLALRRMPFVLKWAAPVLLLIGLGINLPLLWSSFQPSAPSSDVAAFVFGTRWIVSVVLLCCCSMQILFVLHNETLRHAWRETLVLWRLHGMRIVWLLLVIALHFSLLAAANNFLRLALGPSTWPTALWSLLVYPLIWGGFTGWFLASWVSLFRNCEGRLPNDAGLTLVSR